MTRIVLQKTPLERREENPKLPYFQLSLPPEEDGGEWVQIGALWKAKSGNGYSGSLNDNVKITVEKKDDGSEGKSYDKLTESPDDD